MLLLLQLRQPLSLVLNTDRLLKTKNCQQKRNEKNYIERPRYVSQKNYLRHQNLRKLLAFSKQPLKAGANQ